MSTIKDKMAGQSAATPKKIMADNFNNINMSKEEHIIYYRKQAEIDAKLEAERKVLQQQAEDEIAALEKVGNEDNATQGTTEE